MLLLAAAALVASPPQNVIYPNNGPVVQSRATVRIVSGVRLQWNEQRPGTAPTMRSALIRTDTGLQQAKLIEFE